MQQRYGKKYNDYQSLGVNDDSDHPSCSTPTPNPAVLDIEDFGNVLRRNGKNNLRFYCSSSLLVHGLAFNSSR